jgi:hypothetical protein
MRPANRSPKKPFVLSLSEAKLNRQSRDNDRFFFDSGAESKDCPSTSSGRTEVVR